MKSYRILKTFRGSQYGYDQPKEFVEGTTAQLTDYLAEAVVATGEAELIEEAPAENIKASEGAPAFADMTKAELVAYAQEQFGLELDKDDKKDQLIAAIEDAAKASEGAPENKALDGAPENKA